MVAISSAGTGKCVWCCKADEEGVQARFTDGLQGHFCWKDFRAAVKARTEVKEVKEPDVKSVPASPKA